MQDLTPFLPRDRYKINVYDATILAECRVLVTEDLGSGQTFDARLKVWNPFS